MGGCGCGPGSPESVRGSDNLSMHEFSSLLEKGRQMALEMIKNNPAARERVEKAYGKDYCKRRYPEAYGINRPPVYDEPDTALTRLL